MFATPEYVFKDGVLVARDGRIAAEPVGGTHFVEPDYDRGIENDACAGALRAQHGSVSFDACGDRRATSCAAAATAGGCCRAAVLRGAP